MVGDRVIADSKDTIMDTVDRSTGFSRFSPAGLVGRSNPMTWPSVTGGRLIRALLPTHCAARRCCRAVRLGQGTATGDNSGIVGITIKWSIWTLVANFADCDSDYCRDYLASSDCL